MASLLSKVIIIFLGISIQSSAFAAATEDHKNKIETELGTNAIQGISNFKNTAAVSKKKFPHSGQLMFNGGNATGGACGFNQPELYMNSDYVDYYAAAGSDIFKGGNNCGMVIEIANPSRSNPDNTSCTTNSDATVKVMVIDQCHECDNHLLNLAPKPFADLVGPDLSGTCGIINADWRFVHAGLSSNISIQNKEGTNPYWYGFRIFGHNLPVKSVEIKSHGSPEWIKTTKSNGPSFYVLEQGGYPLTPPLSVRFTNVNGRKVKAMNVITNFDSGAMFDTDIQFRGRLVGDPLE